jgi:4a-hydroxytetrahydrobiopterin dehydratase
MNLENELQKLNSWSVVDEKLIKSFTFDTYMGGLNFATAVASLAEDLNHHPDIYISYKKVDLSLFTHDKNEITNKDIELAKLIDSLEV